MEDELLYLGIVLVQTAQITVDVHLPSDYINACIM